MKITVGKHKGKVRGLTRGELKKLRKAKTPFEGIGEIADLEKRDDVLDEIFSLALTDIDPDNLTQAEALIVWAYIAEATFVGDELAKKLESPLWSSSVGDDQSAVPAKKPASKNKGTAPRSKKKNG